MNRIIPKHLFQIIGFGSFILIGIQIASWVLNNDGLYKLIANLIPFWEDSSLEKTLVAGVLVFFALFIPWMIVILILREFTAGMMTMKDEIAHLKGESQPELFKTPEQQARFMGVIAIAIGIVILVINVIVWQIAHEGLISLWLAVPIAFIVGVYAIATGNFPRR